MYQSSQETPMKYSSAQTFVNGEPAAGARAPGSGAAAPALPGCCSDGPGPRKHLRSHRWSPLRRRGGKSDRPESRLGRPTWPRPSSGWPRATVPPPRSERGTLCRCPTSLHCFRASREELHQTGASPCPPLLVTSQVSQRRKAEAINRKLVWLFCWLY